VLLFPGRGVRRSRYRRHTRFKDIRVYDLVSRPCSVASVAEKPLPSWAV